jgi:hypothetical protein
MNYQPTTALFCYSPFIRLDDDDDDIKIIIIIPEND